MTYPINFKNITNEVDFYPELPAVYKKAERYSPGLKRRRGMVSIMGLAKTFID